MDIPNRDPLLDPRYGLDAPTNVARDDLLATQGLLRVLQGLLESEPEALSPTLIRVLARSMQRSALAQHNFGPNEQNLGSDEMRVKLLDNIRGLADSFGEVISGRLPKS